MVVVSGKERVIDYRLPLQDEDQHFKICKIEISYVFKDSKETGQSSGRSVYTESITPYQSEKEKEEEGET